MDVKTVCQAYFNGINEISHYEHNRKLTNALAVLKIISYFTLIIPACFGITLGISFLYDRITKKTELTPLDERIDSKSKVVLSVKPPEGDIEIKDTEIKDTEVKDAEVKEPILAAEMHLYKGELTELEKTQLSTELLNSDTLKIMFKKFPDLEVTIRRQDIFKSGAEAIVNAANTHLGGGAGIDGEIHDNGGEKYKKEHSGLRNLEQYKSKYVSGHAAMIGSGNLKDNKVINIKNVIVVAGPTNKENVNELYSCYYNSLLLADSQSITSLAFPSISTGIFGFPKPKAAAISLRALYDFVDKHSAIPALKRISIHFYIDDDLSCLQNYNVSPVSKID